MRALSNRGDAIALLYSRRGDGVRTTAGRYAIDAHASPECN